MKSVNEAIINPFKVAGFESKERLRGSEIQKIAYVSFSGEMKSVNVANVAIINPFKVAGFVSKERLRSSEIKERQRGDHR